MTSYSRQTAEKESNNSFSCYLDSKYPTNSRSNFTFQQFPISDNGVLDQSLIKRLSSFIERVRKYENSVDTRLVACNKQVQLLEKSAQQKIDDDTNTHNALLQSIQQTASTLTDQCYEVSHERTQGQQEECRWMTKQLSEIKNGFKQIQGQREEQIHVKLRQLHQDMESAKASFQKQKVLRDEISESQIHQFGQQILKIQQLLSIQREQRIQNNQFLLQQISQMDVSTQRLLDQQQQTRQNKEALFTSLLEETYLKLQRQ